MVEELKAVLERISASAGRIGQDDHYAAIFLRDHGQALVEAVADAERYRWLRDIKNPAEVTILERVYEDVYVKDGEKLDQAIDLARTKASAGGWV
jgi:Xaa-Pro aminopeptidase